MLSAFLSRPASMFSVSVSAPGRSCSRDPGPSVVCSSSPHRTLNLLKIDMCLLFLNSRRREQQDPIERFLGRNGMVWLLLKAFFCDGTVAECWMSTTLQTSQFYKPPNLRCSGLYDESLTPTAGTKLPTREICHRAELTPIHSRCAIDAQVYSSSHSVNST